MGKNSTPFLSYDQIKTDKIDLYEDAYGFMTDFQNAVRLIRKSMPVTTDDITFRLMQKIRKEL